jgi:rubredoxin
MAFGGALHCSADRVLRFAHFFLMQNNDGERVMSANAKWECTVCGLVYEEELGLPAQGIAPGTRWEDVPEDFECPDCGIGKDYFQPFEE